MKIYWANIKIALNVLKPCNFCFTINTLILFIGNIALPKELYISKNL